MGEPGEGGKPLLSHKTVTGWATQQPVLGHDIDTKSINIALQAQTNCAREWQSGHRDGKRQWIRKYWY